MTSNTSNTTEVRRMDPIMQLHLGKCIEDLDELHNVPDLKTKRTTVLCKTAQKLFEKAEEARCKGDEENAYVYYMKYLRVVAFLSKEKECQKDKPYFSNMLGTKNPNKAIDAAEKLKKSLIERYEEELKVKQEEPAAEQGDKVPEAIEPAEPAPTANLPGLNEVMIKSEQLYPLLKAGKLKIMILDARPGKDFLESHISFPSCISVPEECISPGQSANVLEQSLPLTSRKVWAERATMELIVMLDWRSTALIPGNKLFLLKTILLKWDIKVQYARPPLALRGGYEDWLLKYPAATTNPQVTLPSDCDCVEDMLGDIEYPNWTDVVPPAAPAAPAARASPRPAPPGEPLVDRASKMAAVQLYEERSRAMQLLLEQQERIADSALSLEMKRIEAEQKWQRVRVQREAEQRDELRAVYQLREQEISSQLMQLENKQYDMEQENQQLRERLEEYQRREREEATRLAGETAPAPAADRQRLLVEQAAKSRQMAAKRARIAAVTSQREQLDRQREAMECERKRKLAEAREKRKPDLDKDEEGDTYMSSPGDARAALSRSVSSPDLLPSSEEEGSAAAAPAFDRTTKPRRTAPADLRARDFEPESGSLGRGLTGLRNMGNTCYMNSVVQCLNNTEALVGYFCESNYMEHINNARDGGGGAVAEELAAVVHALWSDQFRYISINDFKEELGRHHRAFAGFDQQDSHEFLTILMDLLHHDLQYPVKPPPRDNLSPSYSAWMDFTGNKESVVLRLFYGQIKSTVRCAVCGAHSVTYEPFSNLSLELPTQPAFANRCTLAECLRLYLNGETIHGWNCPSCKEKRDAIKKLDISRLPPVLVIHFKRFCAEANAKDKFTKKMTYIDFPLDGLNMKPFSLPSSQRTVYDLYAVSNHYGTMQHGHYTATCKNSVHNKWYQYDDHQVLEIGAGEVKSSAAYILFYAARAQQRRV